MTDTFNDPQDFDAEVRKLARRRQIAEQLVASPLPEAGSIVGSRYVPNTMGMVKHNLDRISGNREMDRIDEQEKLLSANQARNTRQVVEGLATRGQTNGIVQGEGPLIDPTRMVDLNPADEANRRLKIMGQGMGNPTLRQTLMAQIGQEMDYPQQNAVRQENAAARQHQAEQSAFERRQMQDDRQAFTAQQNELYRRTAAQIGAGGGGGGSGQGKAPSGYRWAPDGTLAPIPGGPADKGAKPLTAKQLETQRGFMDLESSVTNYEQMLNGYDFQGKSAVDPKQRAALEGAYTDVQMKLKTLYELGAPQAGDLKLLSQALPNPTGVEGTVRGAAFGAEPFKARLGETKKLLANSRQNFETQFNRPTPAAAANPDVQPPRVRVSSKADFDALPPGTKWEMPDGRKGTKQ